MKFKDQLISWVRELIGGEKDSSVDLSAVGEEVIAAALCKIGGEHFCFNSPSVGFLARLGDIETPTDIIPKQGYELDEASRTVWGIGVAEEVMNARPFGALLNLCGEDNWDMIRLRNGNVPILLDHNLDASLREGREFGVGFVREVRFGRISDFRSGGDSASASFRCLAIKCQFNDDADGRAMFDLVANRKIKSVSVGGGIKRARYIENDPEKGDYVEIVLAKLWEWSITPQGAGDNAAFLASLNNNRRDPMTKKTESPPAVEGETFTAAQVEEQVQARMAEAQAQTKERRMAIDAVFGAPDSERRKSIDEKIGGEKVAEMRASLLSPDSEFTAADAADQLTAALIASGPVKVEMHPPGGAARWLPSAPAGGYGKGGAISLGNFSASGKADFSLGEIWGEAVVNGDGPASASWRRLREESAGLSPLLASMPGAPDIGRKDLAVLTPDFWNAQMSNPLVDEINRHLPRMRRQFAATVASDVPTRIEYGTTPLDFFRDSSAMIAAGVNFVARGPGEVDVPIVTGVPESDYYGERDEIVESNLTIGDIKTKPYRIGTAVPLTDKARISTAIGLEALILSQMILSQSLKMDQQSIDGVSSTDKPAGILNIAGTIDGGLPATDRLKYHVAADPAHNQFGEFTDENDLSDAIMMRIERNQPTNNLVALIHPNYRESAYIKGLRWNAAASAGFPVTDRLWSRATPNEFFGYRVVASTLIPLDRPNRGGVAQGAAASGGGSVKADGAVVTANDAGDAEGVKRTVVILANLSFVEFSVWQMATMEQRRPMKKSETVFWMNAWNNPFWFRPETVILIDHIKLESGR